MRPSGARSPARSSSAGRSTAPWRLALLGTASLGQLRRVGAWELVLADAGLAAAVLVERRPGWLATWADWMLRAQTWKTPWPIVRALVREGAIDTPDPGRYLDGMLATSRGFESDAATLLRRDPGLLDDELWDLIALGGGRADTLTAADAAGRAVGRDAILAGVAPRDRVLDALLAALGGDLVAYRASWHTKLWRALAVTDAERAARVDALARAARRRGRAGRRLRRRGARPRRAAPARARSRRRRSPPRRRRPCASRLKLLDRAGGPPVGRDDRAHAPGGGHPGRGARPARALGAGRRGARGAARTRWTCSRRRNGRAREALLEGERRRCAMAAGGATTVGLTRAEAEDPTLAWRRCPTRSAPR